MKFIVSGAIGDHRRLLRRDFLPDFFDFFDLRARRDLRDFEEYLPPAILLLVGIALNTPVKVYLLPVLLAVSGARALGALVKRPHLWKYVLFAPLKTRCQMHFL